MAKKHAPQILVVDDEKNIRDIMEAFLMLNGYEVDTAQNGKEALDKISSNNYDVVITDLQMPKMDGMELLEKIPKTKSTPITILVTGYGIKESDFSQEPFAHIRKPFSQKQLIQVVKEGLKQTLV